MTTLPGLLTTDQMASFVSRGYLRLEAVVPPDINAQAMDELPGLFLTWLDELRGATRPAGDLNAAGLREVRRVPRHGVGSTCRTSP